MTEKELIDAINAKKPEPNMQTCPNCGYCPHCRQSRQLQPSYPWPYYQHPYYPWQPSITWCKTTTGVTSGNTSISSENNPVMGNNTYKL